MGMPVIGAGSGGYSVDGRRAHGLVTGTLEAMDADQVAPCLLVRVVRYLG